MIDKLMSSGITKSKDAGGRETMLLANHVSDDLRGNGESSYEENLKKI